MRSVKFIGLLIVLLAGATTVYSQGRFNARFKRPGFGSGPGTCLASLTGLTEDQKGKMNELVNTHQATMSELRMQQRSTSDVDEKIAIRQEMLKKVEAHRNDLRKVLIEEQLKQYDQLRVQNFARNRRFMGRNSCCPGQRGFGRRGFRGGW